MVFESMNKMVGWVDNGWKIDWQEVTQLVNGWTQWLIQITAVKQYY